MALLETRFDSQVLDLSVGMNVILPDHPDAWKAPPAVLYLLHGLSDDHTIWSRRTSIERYAADYPLVVVMPDVYKSFYCDMVHGSNYLTFLSEELPILMGRWFNLSSDWKRTFVAGISMGGYGAMKLALDRPDHYSAAASISGALDIASHITDTWDESRLATFNAAFGGLQNIPGSSNDLIAQLGEIKTRPKTEFYTCCGTEDYLYQDSINFREKAIGAGLHLTSEEGPGKHEWGFFDQWIQRVLDWLPIDRLTKAE